MRNVAVTVLLVLVSVLACSKDRAPRWSDEFILGEGKRFLSDTTHRRRVLEESLANHANVYSRKRITAYGLGTQGWDTLPEWNPRSRRVTADMAAQLERGEMPAIPPDQAPLWDGSQPSTMAEWVALGERVFFEYPMRAEIFLEWGLQRPKLVADVGVERTANGDVPGMVVFRNVDGRTRAGITCAICHSTVKDGALVVGSARRRFDYGRLRLAYFDETGEWVDPELAARMEGWGPGRADVTEDEDEDPVAIPDLWGLREMSSLTQAGTIRHDNPIALAIRQETQLTDSNRALIRPPRTLAWALAMYVYSLKPPANTATESPLAARGAKLFRSNCASCHANLAHGGPTLPAATIGTSPALATGRGRGTGNYRVPPLVRVSQGAPYLHDGSVSSLEELLKPDRFSHDYTEGRLGTGAIPGHDAGTALGAADREALLAYLDTL